MKLIVVVTKMNSTLDRKQLQAEEHVTNVVLKVCCLVWQPLIHDPFGNYPRQNGAYPQDATSNLATAGSYWAFDLACMVGEQVVHTQTNWWDL